MIRAFCCLAILMALADGARTLAQTADKDSAPRKPIKLLGDETQLQKIKAAPQEYVGKPFVMTGGIRVDDYYNFGYNEAQSTHYSLRFEQALGPDKIGEDCTLYLRRDVGREIVNKILAKSDPQKLARIRVKAVIDPAHFEPNGWDCMELLDVQFSTPDYNGWGPWVIETRKKAAQADDEQERLRLESEAKQRREAAAKAREQDKRERTRKWTDSTGKFSVVAEYTGTANGTVSLRKQDGKVIKVPFDRLSEADRKWLESRRTQSKKTAN